jgi:ADP-ribose pyrophosphatase
MTSGKIETLHRGRHLILLREGRWEYVQRVSNRGAVFIVAVTPDDELVLVEQARVPLHARCIELPAGILGDEAAHRDESPEACALRELLEESGWRGSGADVLISGPVAAGMTCERLYLVRVTGLTREHAGGGVDGEDITVHAVPLAGVHDWLEQRRANGLEIEPRIYVALYFLNQGS